MKLAALEVRADDLPLLLGPGEDRRHASLEADEPLDVRLGTRVRWGRALYRVAPGGWERPISIIEEARFRAGFVDGVLASALGFGLVDLVEVALRHMDETLACLASSWPGGVAGGGDVRWFVGPGHVTQAEVNALLQAPTFEDTASRCAEPEAAVRALQWASCRASELKANSSTVSGLFGPVLAVNDGRRLVALPVGFLLDGIHDAVDTLTAHALQREGAAELWRQECRRRTLGVLAGRGALLALDAEVQGERILAVELVDNGLLLAVDIAVAGVDGASIADAERRLRHFVPGATYTTPHGTVPIAVRDEVLRLVVIHGTDTALFLQGDQAIPVNWMRIEDLRWIITQAKRPDDLAMFLRDWQGQKAGFVFSFGPFDAWEIWSANDGSLYRGGQLPDALYIEPHGERAEWIKHSDLAWLEEALRDVGVRGLAAWPTVDVDEDACAATISDRWLRTALRIVRAADSAVIVAVRYDPVSAERRTLESIANGLGWKFRHLQADLTRYAIGGVIRIEICHGDEPDATDVARDNDVTVMAIGDGIHEALAEDSAAVERMLGEAIAAAGPGSDETRDAFVAAWCAAPPGIAGDATSPPATVHAGLAPPHPSLVTAVEQRIAGALQAAGIEPGVRRGTDARNLESQHIYPMLQAQLTAALAPFHPDDLLTEVLSDLERVHAQRWLSDGHHARRAALADAMVERGLEPDDVVAEIATDRSEGAILARTVALVVEEALRHPPAGAATPNAYERSTIYAVAHHLLHAGLRSETIHLGLTSSEIEITAAYEIEFHRVRSDVDLDELQYKRAAATMPVRPTRPVDADDDEPTSIVTKLPELAGIDAALCEALGFGIDALITVLAVLEKWMVDVASPIAAATEDEAVAGVTADLVAPIDEGEIRSALSWLTLSRERFIAELSDERPIEHWELDRRANRLATRPVVATSDGRLLIAPWGSNMTRIIVTGNLADGRLPWPERSLPVSVVEALKRYREDRNTALEYEVVDLLNGTEGFRAIARVKKAKTLGIAGRLPGEIDVIAVDERRGRLWVLEVKDRTIALSPRQIRTAIDEFTGPADGYVGRLLRKVDFINAHAAAVAAALSAEPRAEWEVRGAVVTRRVEPAAFAGEPGLPYCTVDTVAATVDADVPLPLAYGALMAQARPVRK